MKIILSILVSILVLYGCKDKDNIPRDVLQPVKMQDVMWDMFEAQYLAQQRASKDSATTVVIETKKLSADIFKIHGITEQKFNQSYQWYLKHPSLLNRMLDSIYSQKSDENRPVPGLPSLNRPEVKGNQLKRPHEYVQ